jgi:argininosuccinate lyase
LSRALAEASETLVGRRIEYSDADLEKITSPRHFIEVRRTLGGPAPDETTRALAESRRLLDRDRAAWQRREEQLAEAASRLAERVRAL